jgi:hypothetical protein
MIKAHVDTPQIIHKSSYDLDVDDDGDTDLHDFEHVAERIYKEVPDERANLRHLKELRAEDTLIEKQRRESERENDRILAEEKAYQREASKSGLRKSIEGHLKPPATHAPARVPKRRKGSRPVARGGQPAEYNPMTGNRGRHESVPQAPSHATRMNDRFSGMSEGMRMFAGSVRGGQSGQGGFTSPLDSFSRGLLPAPRAPATRAPLTNTQDAHLKNFASGLMGGSVSKKKGKGPNFLRLI